MAADANETRRQRALDSLADGRSRTWRQGPYTVSVGNLRIRTLKERRVLSAEVIVERNGIVWFADQVNSPNPPTALVTDPGDPDADPPVPPTLTDNPRAALRQHLEDTVRVSTRNFTRAWDKRLPGGRFSGDTLSVRGDAADGLLSSSHGTWSTAQAGSGLSVNTSAANYFVSVETGYLIALLFLAWDTSTLPDTATLSDATYTLYGTGTAEANPDSTTIELRERNWGPTVTTADWFNPSTTWSGLPLMASMALGSWNETNNAANNLTSQSAALSAINKTGFTYGVVGLARAAGSAPSGDNFFRTYSADQTGTTSDPLLVVNYSTSTPQTVTPSSVAITVQPVAPTVTKLYVAAPSSVAVNIQTVAPAVAATRTATPDPIAVNIQTAAPAVAAGTVTLTPSAVAVNIQPVAPTLAAALAVTPAPVTVSMQTAAPTITLGSEILASPDPVVVTVQTAAPTVALLYAATPEPATVSIQTANPSAVSVYTALPDTVVVTVQTAAPALVPGTVALEPDPVVLMIQPVAPTATNLFGVTPDPVVVTIQTATPVAALGFAVIPGAATINVQTVAPTLVPGAVALFPEPVAVTIQTVTPFIVNGITASPDPVAVLISVATPTVFSIVVFYAYGMMRLAPVASGILRLAAAAEGESRIAVSATGEARYG